MTLKKICRPLFSSQDFNNLVFQNEKRLKTAGCINEEAISGLVAQAIQNVRKRLVAKKDYIAVEPEVLAGKPIISGTRIPVYLILKLLEDGKSIEDIVSDYPELDKKAVQAAIRYAQAVEESRDGA